MGKACVDYNDMIAIDRQLVFTGTIRNCPFRKPISHKGWIVDCWIGSAFDLRHMVWNKILVQS